MTEHPLGHTPIIDMLRECLGHEQVSYHMPGHNRGTDFSTWLHENALRIDTTEFALTDDLHHPTGAFLHAARLAEKAFGSDRTFFVTTGATIAIHSALYALTKPGDLIIAGRNAHRALINACRMFGLRVLFAGDRTLPQAVSDHPDAVLVYLTRPDYYGNAADILSVGSAAHARGIPLVVDEAHGTHFAFCPSLLPSDALSCGGDVVIHSAHKTAPALTQGAFLHVSRNAMRSGRVVAERIADALSVVSTSSPSFLIAATLDYARATLEASGDAQSHRLYRLLQDFRADLSPAWKQCVLDDPSSGAIHRPGLPSSGHDPFRLVLYPLPLGLAPDMLSRRLSEQGIHGEFTDLTRMVLLCKFSNTKEDFRRLAGALNSIAGDVPQVHADTRSGLCGSSRTQLSPEECAERIRLQDRLDWYTTSSSGCIVDGRRSCGRDRGDAEPVPLSRAAGRILASDLIPYPPGIPLLFAGETIDAECVGLLDACLRYGLTVYGIETGACTGAACIHDSVDASDGSRASSEKSDDPVLWCRIG